MSYHAVQPHPHQAADLDRQIVEDARILQHYMNNTEQEFIKDPREVSSSFFVLAVCAFFGRLLEFKKPNTLENKVGNMAIIVNHLQQQSERDLSYIDPALVVAQDRFHVAELLRVFLEIVCPPQHKIHAWRSNVVPPQVSVLDARLAKLDRIISELESNKFRNSLAAAANNNNNAVMRPAAVAPGNVEAAADIENTVPADAAAAASNGKDSKKKKKKGSKTAAPQPTRRHKDPYSSSSSAVQDMRRRVDRFVDEETSAWRRVLTKHHCEKSVEDERALRDFERSERRALIEMRSIAREEQQKELQRQHDENEIMRRMFDDAMSKIESTKRVCMREIKQQEVQRRVLMRKSKAEMLSQYEEECRAYGDVCRSAAERRIFLSSQQQQQQGAARRR
eukprot:PhM_4_TR18628/c0_g1_i1/m.27133